MSGTSGETAFLTSEIALINCKNQLNQNLLKTCKILTALFESLQWDIAFGSDILMATFLASNTIDGTTKNLINQA